MPQFEDSLGEHQFAYRRNRSTEYHLVELYDRARQALNDNKHVVIASLDISGAFDTIPHKPLLSSIRARGVHGYIYRYIHTWLTKRRFALRLASPQGYKHSRRCDVTRGLPQGGVLSPLLWLFHFDNLETLLRARRNRWKGRIREVVTHILIYADDVTYLVAHEDPQVAALAAQQCAKDIQEILKDHLGLHLSQGKSFNIVLSPGDFIHGLFRRAGDIPTATRNDLEQRENQLSRLNEDDDQMGHTPQGVFPSSLVPHLPFSTVSHVRI